ncbi:ricin B lectin domain-containing protein [Pilobolus umbonatus]|nr:ricin B lectin domain-containing protein [Pilobolus umbonatus]KAI8978958.1 ricin B lectin domain-containing protein [Pilobolus umbonatus]
MTDQLYYIKSQFNGLVLDIEGGSTEDGAQLIVWHQKHSGCNNQLWRIEDGYIINAKSAKVLDISGGTMDSGNDIIQYSQKLTQQAANQRWQIDDEGYIACSVRSDLVLDIAGRNDEPGAKVILYERRWGEVASNQKWILERYE